MIRTSNRVALYARFSSDNQRSESIDAQVRAMKSYCEQHNFVIVNTYIDEAKSATTDRRPAFQQMISDSSTHSFNILLVHKLDRFARNRYDSAVYKRELKKNGVTVYSVLENLDDSPESIMMEAVLEGMAEYYSQNLARETMKGLRENALQCKHTGGIPPLGYDIDPITRKLMINEDEAKAVRLIFEMYSQGYGYSAILDRLHELAYKTKAGKDFGKNSLYGILSNPKYQGMYVYNRCAAKSSVGTRNTHLYKDDEEIVFVEDGCPQIVPTEVFAKVQNKLTEHRHTGGRENAKECYLLSGKVFCRECGKAMVGNSRHSGRSKLLHVTYRCPSRRYNCANKEINRDYLEEYVRNLIETQILNANALKKLQKKIEKYAETVHVPTESQRERELKEIDKALQNIAEAIEEGLLTDVLVARLKELEKRKKELFDGATVEVLGHAAITIDSQMILADYHATKGSPSSSAYKEFLRAFVGRIEVGAYSVKITLKTGLDLFPSLDTTYEVGRREIYEKRKTG